MARIQRRVGLRERKTKMGRERDRGKEGAGWQLYRGQGKPSWTLTMMKEFCECFDKFPRTTWAFYPLSSFVSVVPSNHCRATTLFVFHCVWFKDKSKMIIVFITVLCHKTLQDITFVKGVLRVKYNFICHFIVLRIWDVQTTVIQTFFKALSLPCLVGRYSTALYLLWWSISAVQLA